MPLLEGTDGVNKMSKSVGNYIGISEPAETIFGKLMSISDELMWRYIELLSFEPLDAIARCKREVETGRNPREVKVAFAREIVARFHSAREAERAQADFEARFRQGALPEDMPEVTVSAGAKPMAVAQVLKASGLTASTSEALRMIEQGGIRIDGEKLSDKGAQIAPGRTVVLQVGKRKFARVTLG
jgi:tyrosyl-tRNA synthetase